METEEEGGARKPESKAEREYEEFLRDLEEDKDLRSGVLLFKSDNPTKKETGDNDSMADVDELDPDFQDITVDELVDDVATMALDEEDEN